MTTTDNGPRQKSGRTRTRKTRWIIFCGFVRLAQETKRPRPITVAALCSAAGVSQATLYNQFAGGLDDLLHQMAVFMANRVQLRVESDLAVHNEEQSLRVAIATIRLIDEVMLFPNLFNMEGISKRARQALAMPLAHAIMSGASGSPYLNRERAVTIAEYHTDALIGIARTGEGLDRREVAETVISQIVPAVLLDDYSSMLQCFELLELVEGDEFKRSRVGQVKHVPDLWVSDQARHRYLLDFSAKHEP